MTDDLPHRIAPGGALGDLDIEAQIGEGAFATVYRARDRLLHRPVALKVLDPERRSDPHTLRDRVLQEARIVARLSGPHVVTLYRVHELPAGRWAFEMEFMGGGDLSRRLVDGAPLPADEALAVAQALLSALETAHAAGIVHHDIKPANVLLTETGIVKLSDFGLGRFTHQDDLAVAVSRGGGGGTPQYMAPEVVMGQPATEASDLWSFGVLLYRLVQGKLPFPGRTLERLFHGILNEAPPPFAPDVPMGFVEAILACLLKAPADRPASPRAVRDLLEQPARRPAAPQAAPPVRPHLEGHPFVGRDVERRQLAAAIDACMEGAAQTVVVRGEAGIGKSALLREAKDDAVGRGGFRALEAQVGPWQGLRRPLVEALRGIATGGSGTASTGASDAQPFSSRIHEQLVHLADPALEGTPQRVAWVVEHALEELARDRPLLVVIEDAHLADREDFRFLIALRETLARLPVLLLIAYRTRDPAGSDGPEAALAAFHELLSRPGVRALELAPLDVETIGRAIGARFGVTVIPRDVLARVQERADGIPLYALELFRHLLESGEIERREGVLTRTSRWGTTELPRHLRQMVQERLVGLEEADRALLEAAAVAGLDFDGRDLAAVADRGVLDVLRALQRLYRDRAVVRPRERGFRFGHALYAEVLYAGLAPDLRRALHAQWATQLEGAAAAADPEALGWHWERAGELARAVPYLLRASARAVERGEFARAWDLAARSGVLDPDASPERLRRDLGPLLSLMPAYTSKEEADRVETLYARLARAAAALQDDEMAMRVHVASSWNAYFRRGAHAVGERALERAATAVENPIARGDACRLLGRLALERGALEPGLTP